MPKSQLQKIFLAALIIIAAFPLTDAQTRDRPIRVAILDFGDTPTGRRVTEKFAQILASPEIQIIDHDQTRAAVRGSDYRGSLNMNTEDARDLGAAIGCDFFFTGEAQTMRRSSSERPIYFESYATIYLVSARTGKLVSWNKTWAERSAPEVAENTLLDENIVPADLSLFLTNMKRALVDEATERALAIESGAPVIEVMVEETADNTNTTRPPRPYRRLKPEYPAMAAASEVEATVDVLVDVDEKGEVGRVEIARWAGYGLDESVLKTVRQLHFFPAMRDRVAVPMRVLLRYNFRKPPK